MGSLLGQAVKTAPLVEELAGLEPWEACRRLGDLPHLLFLDSAQQSALGRYSFVTADPFTWLEAPAGASDPFPRIADLLDSCALETISDLPPFQGGIAGLFGYDLAHHIEKLPRPRWNDIRTPDLALGVYDWVLSFDHQSGRARLLSTGLPERAPGRRHARARRRRDDVLRRLERAPAPYRALPGKSRTAHIDTQQFPVPGLEGLTSNFDRAAYLQTIQRAIDYVHAGDCFQVNIAQRLLWPLREAPLGIYERLRRRNPAPFAGYFDLGDFVIASASPERFLQMRGREVVTRPIKGTRPRGSLPEEDLFRGDELQASEKDRAENVMIVDLLRNDLGRVCEYGSIQVEALCRLESFRYVHHLVSEVRGRLRANLGPVDLLRATFPGGSVTGAPKIRAMDIITVLEQVARGPYCGSLGYIGFDGAMDTNLLIRTLVLGKGWAHFAVGGGIVADSQPEREYEETWHKARGLLQALT
ncbi:MAG: aminodeoxychorismate synthase component I [Gemmataceae bacterium]|nr:aminodeoxychorismate synthase component I [Gemmataceae bacterium]MCI0738133.1 aminodeoxychorismate synthase component I [Gemmataceae bacterium]